MVPKNQHTWQLLVGSLSQQPTDMVDGNFQLVHSNDDESSNDEPEVIKMAAESSEAELSK